MKTCEDKVPVVTGPQRFKSILGNLNEILGLADFDNEEGGMDLGVRLIEIEKIARSVRKDFLLLGIDVMHEKIFKPDPSRQDRIFVFGSNLAGHHGAGAARSAMLHWGAEYGVGFGMAGQSYAIPTKDKDIQTIPLTRIAVYAGEFANYARNHPDLTFLVTRIGCGLAGYSDEEMAPLFKECVGLSNVELPEAWLEILN